MSIVSLALDAALAVLLIGLAIRILTTRDLFEAIVLFVAFGLTLSLAWVRLGATDIALAEAALGAGVTGALFLNSLRSLIRMSGEPDGTVGGSEGTGGLAWPRWLQASMAGVVAVGLGGLLLDRTPRPPTLPRLVDVHLSESGASNPVTAVLLNFRAYDTLLEVTVLAVALVVVWSLERGVRPFTRMPDGEGEGTVAGALVRLVVPLAIVTAAFLVWVGSRAPGGAFQGAALLAGAGVLLTVTGFLRPMSAASPVTRAALAAGLYAFVAVGWGVMPFTGALLQYPDGWAYPLMIGLEAVLAVSIAIVLLELFVDVPAVPSHDRRLDGVHPTGDPLGRAAMRQMEKGTP